MRKLLTCSVFAVLLLLAATPEAQAQVIDLGVRGSYEVDDIESPALGADLRISTIGLPVVINPAFDYYFLDEDDFGDASFFQFTVNALYEFGYENRLFTPYAGPGLSISRYSADEDLVGGDVDNTDLGINLLAGARFGLGSLTPFIQAQFALGGDIEPAAISAGLLFRVSQ